MNDDPSEDAVDVVMTDVCASEGERVGRRIEKGFADAKEPRSSVRSREDAADRHYRNSAARDFTV